MTAEKTTRSNESGAVILFVAIFLMTALGVTALVVEIPRLSMANEELQRAVDAASLAGASQLDGTEDGWERARSAAQHALEKNQVYGKTADYFSVEIKRGKYWHNPTADDYQFESLEEALDGRHFGLRAASLANSVKVDIELDNWQAIFARALGMNTTSLISDATAVANIELEQCVYPLAIPACSLFERQDVPEDESTNPRNWESEEFDAANQAKRELVFMEASPFTFRNSDGEYPSSRYDARGMGYERHLWYPGHPSVTYQFPSRVCGVGAGETPSEGENCRATAMEGVLGVHSDFPGATGAVDEPATPEELLNFLSTSTEGCIPVRIGSQFRPLTDAVDSSNGLLRNESVRDDLGNVLATLINDENNPKFIETFGDPRAGTARDGFPFLRYARNSAGGADTEQTIRAGHPNWPTLQCHGPELLLGDMASGVQADAAVEGPHIGAWTWTSPLCHDERIPADDPEASRAKEVTVMIIASPVDRYCDFQSEMNLELLDAASPHVGTAPTVVGFLKVALYDFNLKNLDARFPDNTPRFSRPHLGGSSFDLVDKNPRGIQVPDEEWIAAHQTNS